MTDTDRSLGITIPDDVGYIIDILNRHGFEAYLVGGCVRDCILGLLPQDWDIATNAKPQEVKSLFHKTVDTGIKHGTVKVMLGAAAYEVTTYRIEGEYLDGRRPSEVSFAASLGDDLYRRDFTVNALAYHPEGGLVDLSKGLDDIHNGVVRTVGDPDERFREDALRMLRAIRFSAQLGFIIEADTLQSIRRNSSLLKKISRERIRDEVDKVVLSGHPERFMLFYELGLLRYMLPCMDKYPPAIRRDCTGCRSDFNRSLEVLAHMGKNRDLRWTVLLLNISNGLVFSRHAFQTETPDMLAERKMLLAGGILRDLRFDSKTLDRVCRLIRNSTAVIRPDYRSVRKAAYAVGDDVFYDLLKVMTAGARAGKGEARKRRLCRLSRIKRIYRDIKASGHCLDMRDLAVNGHDLAALGYKPGKETGGALHFLMGKVLEDPRLNSREELIRLAHEMLTMREGRQDGLIV